MGQTRTRSEGAYLFEEVAQNLSICRLVSHRKFWSAKAGDKLVFEVRGFAAEKSFSGNNYV